MINANEAVRKILEMDGWTRRRLADELDVPYTTVCRWAKGEGVGTTYEHAKKISNLWGQLVTDGYIVEDGYPSYVVRDDEEMTIRGTPGMQIKIINHGIVRIYPAGGDGVESDSSGG